MVHVRAKMAFARCGILINAGSRDEKGPRGTAHFLEHLLFKGTKKRKAYHILSVIDNSGGELNAYTTKEETFIYASCLRGDLRKAIDVISDVIRNSVFPEKEIEKERGVILDEINAYKDDPGEDILDQFEDLWFAGHELGSNILGTTEDVKKISRAHILDFIQNAYRNSSMVFCTVGAFSFDKILQYARPMLEEFHFGGDPVNRVSFSAAPAPFDVRVKKKIHGAHLLLGFPGVNRISDDRVVCGVLNNALGGPAMNSLLNLSLREKHGICYQIDSQMVSYIDSGIWTVYLNTDAEKLEKAVDLTLAEVDKLRTRMLSSLKVHQMKKQVKGQLALSQENPGNLIHHVGKSYLLRGQFETLKEIMHKVDQIQPQDILRAANEYLDPQRMSRLAFLPR